MEYDYEIVTDSTANLTEEMIEKHKINVLSLNYYIDGQEIKGYEKGKVHDLTSFYKMMREKKEITTSLVSVGDAKEMLVKLAQKEKNILYVGFSSGLSGTYQSVKIAMEELKSEYPNQKFYAVDSLAAALGEGLLVNYVVENREEGMSIEENYRWIEDNKLKLCHWFTVDDLFFLKRGGRISAATAIVGTALSVKPVLHVDDEGHLIPMSKVRGRKKSLDALVKHMQETVVEPEKQVVYISHGDCRADAEYVAKKIKEKIGVKEIFIHILDPVIGAHSGPGTVALFFMGTKR